VLRFWGFGAVVKKMGEDGKQEKVAVFFSVWLKTQNGEERKKL
jgi:hypothetical protein